MYDDVKKEIAHAVSAKVEELGVQINQILMRHVADLMREVMKFGLEDKKEPGAGVALNLPEAQGFHAPKQAAVPSPAVFKAKARPKKIKNRSLAGTGPDAFSKSGSRMPPVGTMTREVYDFVVDNGPTLPSIVAHNCKGKETTLYSLLRQLRKRGFLTLKNGKYRAAPLPRAF